MFSIGRAFGFAAGLMMFGAVHIAAVQTASAQAPASADFMQVDMSKVASRGDCPVEQHRKAINPDIIRCHAKFAPLPDFPQEINPDNPEHFEILREKADVLLEQLDRGQACGKFADVRPAEACAILVYVIEDEFRDADLPWTYVVKIYRTTHPREKRDTVVSVVNSNNSELLYGPNSPDGEVWKLLADQRAKVRCKLGASEFIRNSSAVSSGHSRNPDKCKDTMMDVRYRPVLLIGRREAEKVLNRESIRSAFGPN